MAKQTNKIHYLVAAREIPCESREKLAKEAEKRQAEVKDARLEQIEKDREALEKYGVLGELDESVVLAEDV